MKALSELGISNPLWKTESWQTADDAGLEIRNVVNEEICQLPIWIYRSKRIANARLIAAAPELYECLMQAVLFIGDNAEFLGADCDTDAFVAKAKAALAKASGEEVAK